MAAALPGGSIQLVLNVSLAFRGDFLNRSF
jgi:hypothetical protein